MAVVQEGTDIFIPIAVIEQKINGGWYGFMERFPAQYTCGWHDWHLFRMGAISQHEVSDILNWWKSQGLSLYLEKNGQPSRWIDLCVSRFSQPSLPCSWIAFDDETGGAYLKGTVPGNLIGPRAYA